MRKTIGRLLTLPLWVLLGLFAWLVTAPPPAGFPILEYHMVTEHPRPGAEPYVVPPADFAEQLDYLRREGYTTVTPQDYARARKGKQVLPEKPVVLSFDDGYEDNYRVILPMLDERGMKGVFYMVTNDIGKPGYMTWDNLRALETHGMEIGSHTANHIPLTTLPRERQLDEIRLSKLLLEWNGMKTIYSFSYPNGSYDDVIVEMLAAENYLTAVTGEAGLNTTETDPYRLRRVNIPPPRFGLTEFRLRLFKAELAARLEERVTELPDGIRERAREMLYLLRRS